MKPQTHRGLFLPLSRHSEPKAKNLKPILVVLQESAIVPRKEAPHSLPEGLRAALQLRLEGYSWEEVARLLGRNPNTKPLA